VGLRAGPDAEEYRKISCPRQKSKKSRPGCSPTLLSTLQFVIHKETASVVYWSEFLATDPEVPGSIFGATRFSEK
jgi:hypothetical protein